MVIKLPRPEKPFVSIPLIDSKFRCLLKLDRIDLSLYNISNLPSSPPIKSKITNQLLALSNIIYDKTKSFTITKQYEHNKPLKRLNNFETKKKISVSPEISKQKSKNDSISIRSSKNDVTISLPKKKTNRRSTSSSSMSPIYRPKPTAQKRIGLFKTKNLFYS